MATKSKAERDAEFCDSLAQYSKYGLTKAVVQKLLALDSKQCNHLSTLFMFRQWSLEPDPTETLLPMLKKVQNPKGWKYPVNARVELTDEEIELTRKAIQHYCGSPSEFVRQKNGKVHVTAPGYYACVGS